MAKHKKKARVRAADDGGSATPQAYRLLAGTFHYGGKVYRANQVVWSLVDLEAKHPGRFRHVPDAGPAPAHQPAPQLPQGVRPSAPTPQRKTAPPQGVPGRVVRQGGTLVRNVPQQTAAETPPPPPPPADEDAAAVESEAHKPAHHKGRGGR